MKRGRFYDPPFVLKIALLLCLVIIGLAQRKGWMSRPAYTKAPQEATIAPTPAYPSSQVPQR